MRSYLLSIVFVLSTVILTAQSVDFSYDHHDVTISYGQFTMDQFQNFQSDILDEKLPDDRYIRDHIKGYGGIFLSYKHLTKGGRFLWGLTMGADRTASTVFWMSQEVGEMTRTYYSMAAQIEYRYINNGLIQMYSGIGLGYSLVQEKLEPKSSEMTSSTTSFGTLAYQLNAVGVRIGKQYGGFLELGYGYKGIVNIGFSIQLY